MQLGPIMALISGPVVDNAISNGSNEIAKLAQSDMSDTDLISQLFLRILNRPPTEAEIEAGKAAIGNLPQQHETLVAQLAAYEAQLASETKQKEVARLARIEAARAAVTAREQEIAAEVAANEQARKERIAAADKALKEYQAKLPEKLLAWEQDRDKKTAWQPLAASEMTSNMNAKFAQADDQSINATGPSKVGQYVITMPTDAQAITAIRLEAFTDKQYGSNGPGRAQNGNFVLTELEVTAAPKGSPDQKVAVKLTGAQADFSQDGYNVSTAIDGQVAGQRNGWAISPETGKDHVAAFQFAEPVGHEGGTVLTFTMKHHYSDGKHSLGKFRISVTTSTEPIVLEKVPDPITKILEVAADKRDKKQNDELLNYYKGLDVTLKGLQESLKKEQQPLPIDPRLLELRSELAEAQKPSPVDPKWAQLKADVELSKQQLGQQRLTAAQDIVWALVNSPAFLFNH